MLWAHAGLALTGHRGLTTVPILDFIVPRYAIVHVSHFAEKGPLGKLVTLTNYDMASNFDARHFECIHIYFPRDDGNTKLIHTQPLQSRFQQFQISARWSELGLACPINSHSDKL